MVGQMCHIANFVANPGCRVIALADLRPELAAAAAAKFGVERVYRTHLELLADPDVNGVVVVTRRRATGPIVLDALLAGRHVLSEKPMAYTTAQAATLVDAARQRNLVYGVGGTAQRRFATAAWRRRWRYWRACGRMDRSASIVGARGWCFAGETGGSTRQLHHDRRATARRHLVVAGRPGLDARANAAGLRHFPECLQPLHQSRPLRAGRLSQARRRPPPGRAAPATVSWTSTASCARWNSPMRAPARGAGYLAITFERGSLTIELPPPFADGGVEAQSFLDDYGRANELPRRTELGIPASGRRIRGRMTAQRNDAAGFRRGSRLPTSRWLKRSGNGGPPIITDPERTFLPVYFGLSSGSHPRDWSDVDSDLPRQLRQQLRNVASRQQPAGIIKPH